jgi:hypothetical protein
MIRRRTLQLYARLDALASRRPRMLLAVGAVLAIALALWSRSDFVYMPPEAVRAELSAKEDIQNLYEAASQASWSDVPGWWTGPWIYPHVGYYRPLTSMLFLAEHGTFGTNFTAYNVVSLLLHALNCLLLYLLVCSLYGTRPRARAALGLLAVYVFTMPMSSMTFGVARVIGWWPAQNDILSLTFALASLLLLDRYLVRGRRVLLAASLLALFLSVASKEMGFITMPIAVALIWHRRRRVSLEMAPVVGFTLAVWVFRKAVVPHPWDPIYTRMVILHKALHAWFEPLYPLLATGSYWHIAAAVCITATVALFLKRHWPVWILPPLCAAEVMLCGQFLDPAGSIGFIIEGSAMGTLRGILWYFLGIALFLRYRRTQPGIFAALALVLVFVPILQYGGKHYFYWPAAFLGLVDAVFVACLFDWVRELRTGANWSLPDRILPFLYREPSAKTELAEEPAGT